MTTTAKSLRPRSIPTIPLCGEVGVTFWKAPADMSFDDWQRVGNTLQTISGSINWWIGDWLNEGERRWGEMYAQAIECTGWDYERLRIAKYVAANVDLLIRINNLSWTHHRYIAALDSKKQREWLGAASELDWSSKQLRDAIKESEQIPEPLPSDYDEPAEYLAALYSADVTDDDDLPDEGRGGYRLAAANHAISDTPGYDGDEWYTPSEYIEAARLLMGEIDLDPASCDEAQQVVKARHYFTKDDDGLKQPWFGRVWLNPPYSDPLIRHFTEKLIEEHDLGHIDQAVVITNNSSDTRWFHSLLSRYPACFTRGRVQFWRKGYETFGTRQGQTLFYIGDDPCYFVEIFSDLGIVVEAAS